MYCSDFEFFNSDRVVCTELVNRSYDGLAGLQFPLSERAGRKVLSAEEGSDGDGYLSASTTTTPFMSYFRWILQVYL